MYFFLMIYNITTKGFKLSNQKLIYIDRYAKKVTRFLSDLDIHLLHFDIIIKKYKSKRLDHGRKILQTDSEAINFEVHPKFKSPIYYEGRIWLQIPKKSLVSHSKGSTSEEAIDIGFKRLIKELETYEGKHFPNDSEYYNHTSIKR